MAGHYASNMSPISMKRRTSTGYSPNDQGFMASPVPSPALAVAQAHVSIGMVTPVMAHSGAVVHSGVINGHPSPTSGPGTGLGLSMAGSPMQVMSPSISSPTFMSTVSAGASGNPNKTSKRIRTASATPTLAPSNLATSAGVKNGPAVGTNGTGRNRKSTTRKDSAAKKKNGGVDGGDNLIEESPSAAAGPLGNATGSSTAGQSMANSPSHTLITGTKEANESGSMAGKSNGLQCAGSGVPNNPQFYIPPQSTVPVSSEGQFVGENQSRGTGGAVLFSSSQIDPDPSHRMVGNDSDPQGQRGMQGLHPGLMQMQQQYQQQQQQQQSHLLVQHFQQQHQLQQQPGMQQHLQQHQQQEHLGSIGGMSSEGGVVVPSMVPNAGPPNAALLGSMDFGHASR
ncbi:hypothetical protein EMPS_04150 [Entomortierella parvispora]|uniref:Uncharacterized protein n=1 Tax=Entomortierella parvispora TaxID=205924 RepID=A0A9P3H855_9FUNG|nr:hypothetical protein EMPS_04150 [Entomortierella parvispora]